MHRCCSNTGRNKVIILQVLASRYQLPPAAALPEQPLQQLRADMQQALQLAADLEPCIMPYMPKKTVQTEMQVAAVLAHMETVGMGEHACSCKSMHMLCACAAYLCQGAKQ